MAAASDLGGSAASSAMVLVLLASMVELEDAAIGVSSNKKANSANTVDYLMQFGYLPQSETEAQLTEDQLRNAVRNLQFFGRLNVTGRVDHATANLMSRPRCGVPDVSHAGYRNKRDADGAPLVRVKRYNLQGERWPRNNLTWNLRRGPSHARMSDEVVRRELSHALDMWARETRLTFTELAPDDTSADIQVFFRRGFHGDGYPFDGAGSVLAHAFFPGSGRGGDVHFDDDENWSERRVMYSEVTSVFAVAVHEFGHALGLSHSSVEGSLMFPWYSGIPRDYRLPKDDFEAVQHLYGRSEDSWFTTKSVASGPTSPKKSPSPKGSMTPTYPSPTAPTKCETDFDAVAMIRSEMWVFKGNYFWRIDRSDTGAGAREDPIELSAFWYGLPSSVDRVDAVYERPDHRIVFFVGDVYYVLTGNSRLEAGPVPISRLGLPAGVRRVDAAMVWGWNGRTYFFSDTMYWRFEEIRGRK